MDELRAKLERKLVRFDMMAQDAPADPIPRFEHEHASAGLVQSARCRQARGARADNQDIGGGRGSCWLLVDA